MEKMKRRSVESGAKARSTVQGVLMSEEFQAMLEAVGYEALGLGLEGVVLRDKEEDSYVVLRTVAKNPDFDADEDLQGHLDKEAEKAKKEQEKKTKAEKRAKDKADKEKKDKEDKEQEVEPDTEPSTEEPTEV